MKTLRNFFITVGLAAGVVADIQLAFYPQGSFFIALVAGAGLGALINHIILLCCDWHRDSEDRHGRR